MGWNFKEGVVVEGERGGGEGRQGDREGREGLDQELIRRNRKRVTGKYGQY